MKKSNKKWGFLAPTRAEAKRMEAKYKVHFTPLIDYMKVIFPDIKDWEENRFIPYMFISNGDDDEVGENFFIKPELISDYDHKLITFGNYLKLYDEEGNFTNEAITMDRASDCSGCEVFCIDNDTQLTNATVKQIFGVDVKEPLFDENTPTFTQSWVYIDSSKNAETALEGKYIGDEKQYKVNYNAYHRLYDNIGLSKIIVDELFGLYNYEIDLNTENKISILIGPNGCGKTTILKIVQFMLSGEGNIEEITKVPFKSVSCILANGRKVKIESHNGILNVQIDNKKVMCIDEKYTLEDYRKILNESNCYFNVEFISAQRLFSKKGNSQKDISQYYDTLPEIENDFQRFCGETRNEYNEERTKGEHWLFNEYTDVYSIDGKIKNKRELYEDEVFKNKWREFSIKKYKYENNRAFYKETSPKSKNDKVIIRDDWFVDYWACNMDVEYVSVEEQYKLQSDDKKEFLCLYLDMFNKTLFKIEKAHKKTMLFQRIINDRFNITKKRLKYRFGEMYLTIGEGKDEKEIPLDVLSSGEKNDFIMFYNLIFNCENNKVLIDEPEISLHIEWQERFIDDLSEICEMNNIQALVATHSPNIINDHLNLIADWEIKDEDEQKH